MPEKKQKPFYNRSLERALTILTVFNHERPSLTLAQLAEIVNLPKTTMVRLCTTLIDFGFLSYDVQNGMYSLGLKLVELGSVVLANLSLRTVVSPYLTQLQLKINKTVFLGILQGDELVYIDKKEDPKNIMIFASNIGTRRPLYFGMFGQLLMAYLPEPEVNRILMAKPLTAFTRKSITDEDAFRERLRTIRKNGFAVDEGEAIDGVSGFAAPIRDFSGKVIATVGVGFISSSEDEEGKQSILKDVINTGLEISHRLGYSETADRVQPDQNGGKKFELR
ncbi:MAG TPA: IclR family transcriptional regulator [Syntrophorhabdaceae bacterium]|nr:IclR family transcriptional regulator [Syntrophorhabdaceae bacterium]